MPHGLRRRAACAAHRDRGGDTDAMAPLYVLRLVPRLHDERAVGEHFRRLKQLTAKGVVILAGRTNEPGDRTMGLVVFEAADEAAARETLRPQPAVG